MSSPFRLYTRLCFPSLPGVVSHHSRSLTPPQLFAFCTCSEYHLAVSQPSVFPILPSLLFRLSTPRSSYARRVHPRRSRRLPRPRESFTSPVFRTPRRLSTSQSTAVPFHFRPSLYNPVLRPPPVVFTAVSLSSFPFSFYSIVFTPRCLYPSSSSPQQPPELVVPEPSRLSLRWVFTSRRILHVIDITASFPRLPSCHHLRSLCSATIVVHNCYTPRPSSNTQPRRSLSPSQSSPRQVLHGSPRLYLRTGHGPAKAVRA